MHKLIPLKKKLLIVIGLAAVVAAITRLFNDDTVTVGFITVVVESILLWLGSYTWSPLCRMKYKPAWFIDLNGEWSGTINSLWQNDPNDTLLPPIIATLAIKQNWLGISLTVKTEEMTSYSAGEEPKYHDGSDELHITYVYDTKPKAGFRRDNPPQSGRGDVTVTRSSPNEINIRYTNDRGLGGDMNFTRTA